MKPNKKTMFIYIMDRTFKATTDVLPIEFGCVSKRIAILARKYTGAELENICETNAKARFLVSSVSSKYCHKSAGRGHLLHGQTIALAGFSKRCQHTACRDKTKIRL